MPFALRTVNSQQSTRSLLVNFQQSARKIVSCPSQGLVVLWTKLSLVSCRVKPKGFTLIELLIIIAILGILAAAILITINPLKRASQARDANRKSDLAQIQNALLGYGVDNQSSYPPYCNPGSCSQYEVTSDSGDNWIPNLVPNYLKVLPKDPKQAGIDVFSKLAQLIEKIPLISNVFAANLVGYWKLDEGTGITAADSSGNGNNGTLINEPNWASGQFGSALSFDGSNDYVEVPHNAVLNPSTAITVSLWLKATSLPYGDIGLIGKGPPSGQSYALRIDSDGKTRFYLYVAESVQNVSFTTSGNISTGNWYHLVGTYDSSSGLLRIYLNGELKGTTTTNGTISIATSALSIGGSWAANPFNGTIDDVQIYTTALSEPEIQETYTGTGCSTNKKNVYCYSTPADRQSFIIWDQLENSDDPEAVSQPNAKCKLTPPAAKFNHCVKSS